jgi:hypothetical protein
MFLRRATFLMSTRQDGKEGGLVSSDEVTDSSEHSDVNIGSTQALTRCVRCGKSRSSPRDDLQIKRMRGYGANRR